MTPIQPILEDIKKCFGTSDVRLPGRGDIELIYTVQPRVSQNLAFEEKGGQNSDALNERDSTPTGVSRTLSSVPTYWPPRLNQLGMPSEVDFDSSNQQDEEIVDEKSNMLEQDPETPIAVLPTPRPKPPGNEQSSKRSKARRPMRASSLSDPRLSGISFSPESLEQPLASDLSTAPTFTQTVRNHPSEISTASTLVPTLQDPGHYCKPTRPSSSVPPSLFQKTYTMPFKLWRRVEIFLLRTEYIRRGPPARYGRRTRLRLAPFLSMPDFPDRNASFMIPVHYLRMPFYAVAIALINILYFVVCFPFLLWVIHRHRDVLEDEETLEQQVQESIEMLGPLRENFIDGQVISMQRRRLYCGRSIPHRYQ